MENDGLKVGIFKKTLQSIVDNAGFTDAIFYNKNDIVITKDKAESILSYLEKYSSKMRIDMKDSYYARLLKSEIKYLKELLNENKNEQELKFCGYNKQALIGAMAQSKDSENVYSIQDIIVGKNNITLNIHSNNYNEEEFLEDLKIIPDSTGKYV